MSQQRIGGRDVRVTLSSGITLLFNTITLNPDIGLGVAKSQGRPDGWLTGEVGGEGEATLTTEELDKLIEAASEAGSWEALPPVDVTFYGRRGTGGNETELKVEAFGVKFSAPNFNFDATNNERLEHTIGFMVTSPDFIRINGTPLIEPRP